MMNDEELLKALKEHRKTCFRKRYCELCSIDYDVTGNIFECQCDICGVHGSWQDFQYYVCKCSTNEINVCKEGCTMQNPYEIIYDDEDHYREYIDKCCPMTKAAK
tara:strand:- start:30194 stop:30508 length:315 start_codon:yes stop_codon:yes gene_type:complete